MEHEVIIRKWRCCMCPQINKDEAVCPTGPGKDKETTCGFVITWLDERNRRYKVIKDMSGNCKGHYKDDEHSEETGWKAMQKMNGKESFDEAQEELNGIAVREGWMPMIKEAYCKEEELWKR